jgi:ketosteroid isomerase-like protein
MKKLILLIYLIGSGFLSFSQNAEKKKEIEAVLSRQVGNWNKADIPAFMEDYYKSDDLKFIGKNGVVKGWEATKQRYLKSYPDKAAMGTLKFDIQEIDLLSKESAWVLGKFHLTRPDLGDLQGYFTLIFKKINGKWLIVSDHTSG